MRAKIPFEFHTSSQLVEITSQKAGDLKEFREILKGIDGSSIFYHVHHAFREHQFAPGVYTNDFAHWVDEELNENVLAEKLANINLKDFTEIKAELKKVLEEFDHHNLNELPLFAKQNPTAENLAREIYNRIKASKVIVWESDKACASYS